MKLPVPSKQVSCRATPGRPCFYSPGADNSQVAQRYLVASSGKSLELCLLITCNTVPGAAQQAETKISYSVQRSNYNTSRRDKQAHHNEQPLPLGGPPACCSCQLQPAPHAPNSLNHTNLQLPIQGSSLRFTLGCQVPSFPEGHSQRAYSWPWPWRLYPQSQLFNEDISQRYGAQVKTHLLLWKTSSSSGLGFVCLADVLQELSQNF